MRDGGRDSSRYWKTGGGQAGDMGGTGNDGGDRYLPEKLCNPKIHSTNYTLRGEYQGCPHLSHYMFLYPL